MHRAAPVGAVLGLLLSALLLAGLQPAARAADGCGPVPTLSPSASPSPSSTPTRAPGPGLPPPPTGPTSPTPTAGPTSSASADPVPCPSVSATVAPTTRPTAVRTPAAATGPGRSYGSGSALAPVDFPPYVPPRPGVRQQSRAGERVPLPVGTFASALPYAAQRQAAADADVHAAAGPHRSAATSSAVALLLLLAATHLQRLVRQPR